MEKIGLALSGGGFRASLFHLGVIRYLINSNLIDSIVYVSGVSGGSIVAAHLVQNWDRYTSKDEQVVNDCFKEIIDFTRSDIRGRILRRTTLLREQRIKLLVSELDKLYKHKRLEQIQENSPNLLILATNLTDGNRVVFSKNYYTIYDEDSIPTNLQTDSVSIALAVAASAAFPAIFSPVVITPKILGVDQKEFGSLRHFLSDGGILDNSGIDIINKIVNEKKIDSVLVSNAGGAFDTDNTDYSGLFGLLKTSLRSTDILMDKIATNALHSVSNDKVKIISISESTKNTSDFNLSLKSQHLLKKMRTDLDRFSSVEVNSLVLHGQNIAKNCLGDINENIEPWIPIKQTETHSSAYIESSLEESVDKNFGLFSVKDIFGTLIVISIIGLFLSPFISIGAYYSDRYSFKSYPFNFELEYPASLGSDFASCFKKFMPLQMEQCLDILPQSKLTIAEQNRLKEQYANDYIKDLNIKADNSDAMKIIDRYCKFLSISGKKGTGDGYILSDPEHGVSDRIKKTYFLIKNKLFDKENNKKMETSDKGFILFSYPDLNLTDGKSEKEHGFAFSVQESKEDKLIIEIAQPSYAGRNGALWQLHFPLDKTNKNRSLINLFEHSKEIKGYSSHVVSEGTKIPLRINKNNGNPNCYLDKKAGNMKFSEITLKQRS